jgi:beta-glucosidase
MGGETCTDLLLELLDQGRVRIDRIDESVRRILLVKFRLGLFDDPYVDEDAAEQVVGAPEFREAGHRAQAEAVTVLKNDGVLPLPPDGASDVAVVRLAAPFEPRNHYFLEAMTHQGSLEFPPDVVDRVAALAARGPVVLVVHLDRPAILTPFDPLVRGLAVEFGASDAALFDALTGRIPPRGRLPVELPRSVAAVLASRPDVASDTADPLYPVGAGLDLPA